jgi:AmmeMemoRadiSam system protein A
MHTIENLFTEQMIELHMLASVAIETAVRENSVLTWKQLHALVLKPVSTRLEQPSGAFVTLKKFDDLRGCIGYIMPIKPLYQAVMENGVNAALQDTRFPAVQSNELSRLDVEISVLTTPEQISSYNQFHVGVDGIIMDKNRRSAVFLPEVAKEQGWNREQTLTFLSRKAGLPENAWRDGAVFRTFRSQKYSAPIRLKKVD